MGLLTAIIFILAGATGAAIAATVIRREKNARRARALSVISGQARAQTSALDPKSPDGPAPATEQAASSATDIAKKLRRAARDQKNAHNTKSVSTLLLQSGMGISVARFWIISSLVASAFSGVITAMHLSPLATGLLTFTAYFGAPRFFLRFKAARRQKAFLDDFADALEAMIRLLKAGMPVTEAIAMVGREFSGPVGDEMGRIYDAQKVGIALPDAVKRMAPRMPIPEVQMFATAIAIQAQTGSSLSEVLGNLSGVIRARTRLKRKVQALSAEAKASASIIGALPVLVSLALWGVNPDYISLLFTHPTGKMLLTGAVAWMSLGILAMRQMINFKV